MRIGLTFEVDIKSLPIFFSGAKGFHIFIPSKMIGIVPSPNIAMIFKKFAELLLTPWGIKYDAQIYDTTRLFRVNNTRNSKTELFKVALTAEEIIDKDIPYIKGIAAAPRDGIKPEPAKFNPGLAALYKDAVEKIHQKPAINNRAVDSNQAPPKITKLCYHELLKGLGEGERDAATYRLACYFKHQGLQEDMVTNLLLAWNSRNTPPLPERTIEDKVKSAFSDRARDDFGCNDSILQAHCQKGCYLLGKSNTIDVSIIKDIEESAAAYERHIENYQKRKFVIDLPHIGPAMRGGAYPGETIGIEARSGVGKTAILMNLLMRAGLQSNLYQAFFSMEMPSPQLYERLAQSSMGISGREVEEAFRDKEKRDYLMQIQEQTRNMFKRMLIVDKDCLSVEEMIALVRLGEQKVNQKIGAVAIDYLGRMRGPGKNPYEALSYNALALKHMAKELDIVVLFAVQVSRKGGDGSIELDFDSARDSGQIAEASDFSLAMWRPQLKENAQNLEDKLKIRLTKNRRGPQYVDCEMKFIKSNMRIDSYDNSFWDIPEPEPAQSWYDNYNEQLSFDFADDNPF